MAQIDDVISACGYTEYHKSQIQPYYNDALNFLRDAGVPESVVVSSKATGCIARYVQDTFNLNSNAVNLSPFFYQRLKQLMLADEEVTGDEKDAES